MISYILLTGCPPFQGENLAEVYNEILYEKLKLYRSDWEELSPHSLDFVKNLLKKNPDNRLTAQEALEHPFITQKGQSTEIIKKSVLEKLAADDEPKLLKQEVFSILSVYIKSGTIEKWNKCFHSLDSDGTGQIKMSEIIQMLKDTGIKVNRVSEIEEQYKDKMDAKISYSNFLTKVINVRKEISEAAVKKAFEQLDKDNKGKIDAKDLTSFLKRKGIDTVDADHLLNDVDKNKNALSMGPDQFERLSSLDNGNRQDISLGTFKEYILGAQGDQSEIDEFSVRSSVAYDAELENHHITDEFGHIIQETKDESL